MTSNVECQKVEYRKERYQKVEIRKSRINRVSDATYISDVVFGIDAIQSKIYRLVGRIYR